MRAVILKERKKKKEQCGVLVARLCLTLQSHGLQPSRLLSPWDSPGKNTGVGCHFLLQGVFLTQGSNSQLLHCRQSFYQLGHQDPYKPCAGHRVWVLLQVNLSRHPLPSALAFLPLLDCTGHQEWSGTLVRFPSSCGCDLKEGIFVSFKGNREHLT